MINPHLCTFCIHYLGDEKCKAFPDGIPNDVFCGYIQHTEPVEGDNGIIFEPNEEGKKMFGDDTDLE